MEKKETASSGTGNFRRVWDKQSFSSSERKVQKNVTAEKKASLQARAHTVDFESSVGLTTLIQDGAPDPGQQPSQPGFYCKICDIVVKDSSGYLDHVNGKKHQRILGMSLKVENVTVEDVRQRLEYLKRKKDQEKEEKPYNVTDAVEAAEDLKRKRVASKKAKKNRAKRLQLEANAANFVDADVAAVMGFGKFGT